MARLALVVLVLAAAHACVSARLAWLKKAAETLSGSQGPGLPCDRPVKRAPVVFPENLITGGTTDEVMYSGYVNVTESDHLFYWLAEAQAGAPADAPLVIWTNGGPGCSAMEGMTTEHGPLILYDVKEDGRLFSGKLSKNPYAWNREAHVLYVDQPRYVGYSCGTGPFVTSSLEAGRDMVTFLRGWRLLFPEHAHRNIIFAAESYGGHYMPAWTAAVMDYNIGAFDPIRLIGMAIGNGIVNETIQGSSFPEFARRQGLIPRNDTLSSEWGARELMKTHLGYEPNYYDYRLAEQDCCGCSSYNYQSFSAWHMREDVMSALNVCGASGAKAFGDCAAGCVVLPEFDKNDQFSYSGAIGRALERGIRVTFYYGMQDTACNYVGGFAMASSIEWTGAQEFISTPLEDLRIGGVATGSYKSSGGLTWIQVEGAGHMVPINNPAAASFAISTLIKSSSGFVDVTNHRIPIIGKWMPLASKDKKERSLSFSLSDVVMVAAGVGMAVFVALRALPWVTHGHYRRAPAEVMPESPLIEATDAHDSEITLTLSSSE